MDTVYRMLNGEQKKLKERKARLNQVVLEAGDGKTGTLGALKTELANLREAYAKLKADVRSAVESELKTALQGQLKQAELYNLPRQMAPQPDRRLEESLKKKEKELADREKELYEWETSLFQKNLQIEEMFEQYGLKMNKMATQKSEIQQSIKKLQVLTSDYQALVAREESVKAAETEIATQRKVMQQQQEIIDRNMN